MATLRRASIVGLFLLIAAGCATNRYGPWYTPSGNQVSSSIMVEFEGFKDCGTDEVVFIRFLGKQYASDPQGQLGTLRSADGMVISFAELDGPPAGAEATGVRHQDREIWRSSADIENYLYVVYDSGFTQRWPRAEARCER